MNGANNGEKRVRLYTPANPNVTAEQEIQVQLKRVAAYCRVSTDEADQLNSYEVQKRKYNEHILSTPGWQLVGIYADKGISGTQTKHREEFKRMIRHCKQGKIDIIITKSVSRFARNNLDTLKYTRLLREIGVDVYFEEQNIHSIDPSFDFLISLHGSLAQSESENLSKNVKWGKLQAAKEGRVPFSCKNFLGYRRNEQGKVEIDPHEEKAVRLIFNEYIKGTGLTDICRMLENGGFLTAKGNTEWTTGSVESVVQNEKYKGVVITNKTYTVDPISKKQKANEGEVPQYIIENNHPAIVDAETFRKAQIEFKRRHSMKPAWTKSNKAEKGYYSAKHVLNDILVCGDCGSPYRRRTWYNDAGDCKYVWRCMKRVEYGTRYCKKSPTLPEIGIFAALEQAIAEYVRRNDTTSDVLCELIKARLQGDCLGNERITELKITIAKLDEEFDRLLNAVGDEDGSEPDMDKLSSICQEKQDAENELLALQQKAISADQMKTRYYDILSTIEVIKKHPYKYEDGTIRELIARIVVVGEDTLKIVFKTGHESLVKVDLETSKIYLPRE